MNGDRYVTAALILEVVSDIRLHLRKLTELTERSLAVHGAGFEVFSKLELMEQSAKASASRKRHADLASRDGVDADSVVKEADARFQAEAESDVLSTMLIANHDAARPGDAYWSRQRVEDFAAEYQPEGRRWKEHKAQRESHIRERGAPRLPGTRL